MRAIFLFLIVIIVFLLIMTVIRGRQERRFAKEQQEKNSKDSEQKMVSCEVCHTYLPEKEAICRDGKCFCGEKHLRQFEND